MQLLQGDIVEAAEAVGTDTLVDVVTALLREGNSDSSTNSVQTLNRRRRWTAGEMRHHVLQILQLHGWDTRHFSFPHSYCSVHTEDVDAEHGKHN